MRVQNFLKTTAFGVALILCFLSVAANSNVQAESEALKQNQTEWKEKIDSVLLEEMEAIKDSKNKTLQVYLWYQDINQTQTEQEVEKRTGITKEDINTDLTMPEEEVLKILNEADVSVTEEEVVKKQMEVYLEKTKEAREEEQELTDQYIETRREVSKEMYQEVSSDVLEKLDVEEEETLFRSSYAPMCIAELTYEQIISSAKNKQVESISLYVEEEMVDTSYTATDLTTKNSLERMMEINGFTNLKAMTDLDGTGVVIGTIENNAVISDADEYSELPAERFTAVKSCSGQCTNANVNHAHVNSVAKIMAGRDGIASGARVYSVGTDTSYCINLLDYYSGIEALIEKNVKVISSSFGNMRDMDLLNPPGSYVDKEIWLDHIAVEHHVTFVQAVGNDATNLRIAMAIPALAYNVIAVGAMYDNNTENYEDDIVYPYSQYNHLDGCYKPDLVAPANVLVGGTSSATPVVTGIIALMLELKPSLAAYPQAIKAILLAACHRKAKLLDTSGNPVQTEVMTQGLTNRQGAGVLNAYAALSIVGRGQYGVGEITDTEQTIQIVQPAYNSKYMNVSIAWMQNNHTLSTHTDPSSSGIGTGLIQDIDLNVYRDGALAGSSTKANSSTEMVYFPIAGTSANYRINISKYNQNAVKVYYGYAWSTDTIAYQVPTMEGIYYVKNKNSGRYLDLDAAGNRELIQYVFHGGTNQQWILRKTGISSGQSIYQLKTNFTATAGGLTRGTSIDSNSAWGMVQLTGNLNLQMKENDDGTYSILNKNTFLNRWDALEVYGASLMYPTKLCWNLDSGSNNQRWYLEQLNYQKGDVNMDGKLDSIDIQTLQKYLQGTITLTEAERYLADMNGGDVVDSYDLTLLQKKIS